MGTQAIEVVASFPATCAGHACGLQVLADGATGLEVTLDVELGLVLLNGTSLKNSDVRAGPLPAPKANAWSVHAIVDHSIVELIVNDDIAFVIYVAPTNVTAGNVR
eukprot:4135977-Prymnesium_polylepis.1